MFFKAFFNALTKDVIVEVMVEGEEMKMAEICRGVGLSLRTEECVVTSSSLP